MRRRAYSYIATRFEQLITWDRQRKRGIAREKRAWLDHFFKNQDLSVARKARSVVGLGLSIAVSSSKSLITDLTLVYVCPNNSVAEVR